MLLPIAMRERGAEMTDMAVLIVAADEGVLRQTEEAIDVIQQAKVPFITAINKIDKDNANPSKVLPSVCLRLRRQPHFSLLGIVWYTAQVKRQLLQYGVILEEFGGEVQCVELSATTGKNLDLLTDAIQLQAEMLDLRVDPDGPADAVIIESKIDKVPSTAPAMLMSDTYFNRCLGARSGRNGDGQRRRAPTQQLFRVRKFVGPSKRAYGLDGPHNGESRTCLPGRSCGLQNEGAKHLNDQNAAAGVTSLLN